MAVNNLGLFLFAFLVSGFSVTGQSADMEYWQVVRNRAQKIVTQLDLKNEEKAKVIENLIAIRYVQINTIDEEKEAAIEALEKGKGDRTEVNERIAEIEDRAEKERGESNRVFVKELKKHLTNAQVDQVKDGMTYGVLPLTYNAFLEMLPQLTRKEKKYIYKALTEAREHAMSAGSSKEKHGWFGKYKGRINNYLSARGYDLNKANQEWQAKSEDK